MSRLELACAAVAFVGLALLLSETRVFRRVGLVERLETYTSAGRRASGELLATASFREAAATLSREAGERLARLFHVGEELGTRLERIHSPMTVTAFRVRQVGWSATSTALAVLLCAVLGAVPALSAVFVIGAPLLSFLLLEQRVATASRRWQRRIFLELPVVTEQLGMLLAVGWSVGSAMARLSQRGAGACAIDLRRALGRVRQGLSEIDALREWAELADVDALHRLVGVLALNRQAADLGRLISEEARAMRQESQREMIESIERRTQQVWVPVTAASLVPGVMLMGVPFLDALTLFSA